MRRFIAPKKSTLKQKLFGYMFLLVLLLFFLFFIGLYLIGGYTGTKQQIAATLRFQAEIFERQVTSHYSSLAVMGIQLSQSVSQSVDGYLEKNRLDFDALKGSQTHIAGIQNTLLLSLRQKLLETDCTGAFILLDTQINPSADPAGVSRSGLYLQRNSLDSTDTRILLYRGLSQVGKDYDAMPHRKWRLEFSVNEFPCYDTLVADAALPLTESYRLTDVVVLPGTSECVMLLALPIFGENGRFYGLCGFEISESYFKHIFAQPSELSHAIFCLSRGPYGLTDGQTCLSAGIANDYYLAPSGNFSSTPFGSDLFLCESEKSAYVGIIQTIHLCPGNDVFSLSTLMLRQDYDQLMRQDVIKVSLLLAVFVALAALCCLYFSRSYLRPLKRSIEQIRQKEYTESQITEIDDLFAFLADQDRQREAVLHTVQEEKASVEAELAKRQSENAQAQLELKRLAYSRKKEVDPDDYESFRRGIQDLTETERRVFEYYLQGKTVKEITELMGVKESTIRFHNRNIYVALGVNSLKQLLLCAAILRQEEGTDSGNQRDPV